MRQYEIWWARFPEPIGRRPVLLLSRTTSYEYRQRALAVEITTTIRGIPQEIALGPREGMTKRCVASCDNIHVVPLAALERRAGALSPRRELEVKRALGHALGWAELTSLVPAG